MKILTVATAWGSRHGGVNVFNYRLCCALSALGHDVTSYVKKLTLEDLTNAQAKKVHLKGIDKPSDNKWTQDDVGYINYADLDDIELLIVHDIIGKVFLDHFPLAARTGVKPIVAVFIHTLYRDTDYFGDLSDDKRRERTETQYSLMDKADIVFTSGGWIAEQLKDDKHELKSKIRAFVPGRLDLAPCGSDDGGSITTFGRLSLSNDKKQASSVLRAYKDLASDLALDTQAQQQAPDLRLLGVNCPVDIQQEIKRDVFANVGWQARVEFLDYQHYYDFETSEAKKILAQSKIVLTPSIVESFGLTSLEAICLGIPLIASRRSGFSYELKKVVHDIPESAIDWLEVSDFTNLSSSLKSSIRQMLRRYESYRSGAMVLAEGIVAKWPTWEQSCKRMCAEISDLRLSEPVRSLRQGETVLATGPFEKLRGFGRLTKAGLDADQEAPSPTVMGVDQPQVSENALQDPPRRPLADLVVLAYGRNAPPGTALAKLLIERYKGKTCTGLQQQVAEALSAKKLHNYQDILLCGGTSSGKTTTAEILFGLANDSDFPTSRILYLAPTRALAQERWREWSQCFESLVLSRCNDNVIISTGEDHSTDRALARGEFLIACVVFEKANVILSTSPELVNRLTMIVLDELHMVADIHRGPIIETLLAKLKYEKRRRQKRDDLQIPMRIVGITTEQSTAEGFSTYFTNLDRDTDQDIPPLTATDVGRPTQVQHILIEPESSGQTPYCKTPIATFAANEPLRLTQDALDRFAASLPKHASRQENGLYRGQRGKRLMHVDKYLYFIKDWLSDNPHGRRLLAFIGSKADQVQLADRLQAEVKRSYTLANRAFNFERLAPVLEQVKNDDTSISIDVLNRALGRGIFIHNADINRSLRFAMEDYLSEPLPLAAASEVIVATETLSYGVNLSIDDVALLSLEFPASERNQEYGAAPRMLSRCAFANMCGRAGRLNQKNSGNAAIYIWPITDHETSARRLVEIFYCDEETVGSKLVHGDDKEAYERLAKNHRTSQAPLLFTYPFVRTFLDGLRFTGGAPGLNGATKRNDASIEELEDEFTDHLLYSQENRHNDRNMQRLHESVKLIIEESMAKNLELVKKSGRGFKITQLGSAIIDTGTEISTLEPLKKALESLLSLLRTDVLPDSIPVEVLLLPIVVQNEAHRQVVSGMPEFRTEVAGDKNRNSMLTWVKTEFLDWGFNEQVVRVMEKFLAKCDEYPRHAPSGDTSTELVHDACLRLFCGLLLWVSGESIANIHTKLKSLGKISGNAVQVNTNFATFADRIGWKLMLLGDLMRFTTGQDDVRMLQTKARRLNIRLRLGCAENALPFLAREGNRASAITRKTAHEILRLGATPKTISSGEFDLDSYSLVTRNQIKTQVRSYIRSSFHQLKNEFNYSTASQGADAICRAYWEFADTAIRRSTENAPHMPAWPTSNSLEEFYVSVPAGPGIFEPDSPTVRLREEDGVLYMVGHKLHWDDDTKVPVDAVKWQVQACHGTGVIHSAPPGYKNVVVDFPWLLRSVPGDQSALRMSPAAFGILLTLITRSFLKDSVGALEVLSTIEGSISSLTLLDRLYSEVIPSQLPDALFDAWAGYWDAD